MDYSAFKLIRECAYGMRSRKGELMFQKDFTRLILAAPELALGNPKVNSERGARLSRELAKEGADLLVFPPLALSGVSLGDLNLNPRLLATCLEALDLLAQETKGCDTPVISSLPLLVREELFFSLALLADGDVKAFLPLPVRTKRPDLRLFSSRIFLEEETYFLPDGRRVPLLPYGTSVSLNHLMEGPGAGEKSFVCLIDDADGHICLPGAGSLGGEIVLYFSLEKEYLGRKARLHEFAKSFSRREHCALALLSPSWGESSGDGVFSGYRLLYEDGDFIAEAAPFSSDLLIADLDSHYLRYKAAARSGRACIGKNSDREKQVYGHKPEPGKNGTKIDAISNKGHRYFLSGERPRAKNKEKKTRDGLYRPLKHLPFLPDSGSGDEACKAYYEEALTLLSQGLCRRMARLPKAKLILGLSGGLDSCLALLICLRSLDLEARPREDLLCVSMPGPGSHEQTKKNARELAKEASCSFLEIPIDMALHQHLQDIGHDGNAFDTTFENAQARERTQILMDLANRHDGMVIGTGDLSELALGWCTYNGDQMAMYNLNASVPKTLVRALCQYEAERCSRSMPNFSRLIFDVLATPISPELLPRGEKGFRQKTEDILGPYELHDFFLWHLIKRHAGPEKIKNLAYLAFSGRYSKEQIDDTLAIFLKRFVQNQFKRSASPDGASLNLISLSPREGFVMPSDLPSDFFL